MKCILFLFCLFKFDINFCLYLPLWLQSMQEAMPSRPQVSGMHHQLQMPTSTSCSYNSYPVMHNSVAPGNNLQPMDGNLYGKPYNIRPPYPSTSNQFSYLQADQQVRPQREVAPQPYYDRSRFGQSAEGGQFYGDQDNIRPPRNELTDGWGYSRPPFPSKTAYCTSSFDI